MTFETMALWLGMGYTCGLARWICLETGLRNPIRARSDPGQG